MSKKSPLALAVAAALIAPMGAQAEIEVSGYLKNETAVFTDSGQTTGQADSMLDNGGHDSGDLMKFENSARLFFNGDIGEESSWHGELNFIYDSEGVNSDYKGPNIYTQNDWFRELYVDTTVAGVDLRLGKQQVVWGTADGIKLLDIINPTDFRELNQNAMEDARIPIWMINAERNIGESSNIQFIVSQVEENKIAGLNKNGDAGHSFIMKGVDSMTGQVNGFMHVAPALSNVAATFNGAAMGGAFTGGMQTGIGLNMFAGLTVDGFASGFWDAQSNPGQIAGVAPGDPNASPGYILLNGFAQNGFTGQPGFPAGAVDTNGNFNTTNLMPVTGENFWEVGWNPSAGTSAFELMPNATFATFNTFTGFDGSAPTGMTGMESEWVRDYPDDWEANAGFRFRSSLDNGLNFSLNYFYHYSANPDVDLSYHDSNTGDELTVQRAATMWLDSDGSGTMDPTDTYIPNVNTNLTREQSRANFDLGSPTSILLHDGTNTTYYGALDPTATLGQLGDGDPFNDPIAFGAGAPTLRFTEKLHRVHSIGASFDYAMEIGDLPLVLRGEFLYDKGDKQPVVDKYLLSIGDLSNALKMEDADYFKYVIGVDATVLTNLLISGQFIQYRNLDYVDSSDRCTSQGGNSVDCSRYTADFASLHLTNGLNEGYENKEFYSLFLSKPFGESQLGRVNNIIIYEEGGGYWDRIDAEYSLSDQLILTGELNFYWGDENTTFGQFKESTNAQIGVKWILD